MIALACLASACRPSERDGLRTEHLSASEDLSQRLWGAPMEPAQREEHMRMFDCVAEQLGRGGASPEGELACWIRRQRATAVCLSGPAARAERCVEEGDTACRPSPAFAQAAEACRSRPPGR